MRLLPALSVAYLTTQRRVSLSQALRQRVFSFHAASHSTDNKRLKMGGLFSRATPAVAGKLSDFTIDVPPVTSLYDDLVVTMYVPPPYLERNGQYWLVEYERDVSYACTRYELAKIPASCKEKNRVSISSDAFRALISDNALTADDMCNISALHFSLYTGRKQVATTTLVVDVFRENPTTTLKQLQRRIYGPTSLPVSPPLR